MIVTKDVANTYLLSNGEVTATLYYQPVISAVQFENDLTLFKTTKPPAGNPDYYTPDFVLKFASSEDDEEYAIFDAKFSSRANIKKHSLPEVIRKYSCEISVASRSSAPPKWFGSCKGELMVAKTQFGSIIIHN